jgi:hypothetical protein
MNRKAIVILGAIFLLIVATLVFLIIQRSKSKNSGETNTNTVENQNTETNENTNTDPEPVDNFSGPVVKLTDDQVVTPVLFYQGDGVTYLTEQGELFQVDLEDKDDKITLTNKRQLTLPSKSGISKILWPASGNHFIAERRSATGNPSWSVYNSEVNAYTDLPSQVTAIDWLPQGNKIIYIWLDSNNKSTLNTASPDNSDYKTVADIWENDDDIKVSPDGQSILFFRKNSSDSKNVINLTTPDGSLFRSVIKDGYNFGVIWAPDSKRFLFGRRTAGTTYELWLGDIADGAVRTLSVDTVVEKAIWDRGGQFVYAAVPTTGDSRTGLTEDKIVKINVASGEKKEYDLGSGIDVREMFLSINGDKLLFKNQQDGGLYYLNLNK